MTSPGEFEYSGPIPRITEVSRPFWEGAKGRKLMLQRSTRTGQYVFYPRPVSPFGADDTLEWVEASGRGHVFAFTIAREPTAAHFAGKAPYVIAVVELEEGPRMTANILGCDPDSVYAGMPVEATYVDIAPDRTLVQFRPTAS